MITAESTELAEKSGRQLQDQLEARSIVLGTQFVESKANGAIHYVKPLPSLCALCASAVIFNVE